MNIFSLIPPEEVETETFTVECQTVDHPIPPNKVPNYKWNIWDLKREALLLVIIKPLYKQKIGFDQVHNQLNKKRESLNEISQLNVNSFLQHF